MENMSAEELQVKAKELMERYVLRKYGINIRLDYTKTICEILKPKDGQVYADYTNVIYKGLFGVNADKIRALNNLPNGPKKKANLRDYADTTTLKAIQDAESFVINLLRANMTDIEQLTNMVKNWAKGMRLQNYFKVSENKITFV